MHPPSFARKLFHLQNGLRLVTINLPHRHRVTLAAYVRVGSRFETSQDNGLSHFLEHMLFRGTTHFPNAYLFNRAIEEIGGTLHAETRRDMSLYQLELPPECLKQGLDFFTQIFTEPTFGNIETERKILLEEAREDLDEKGKDANLSDLIYSQIFREHPLGQKIVGPIHNIERFSEEDLLRHFHSHYRAKNIIFCVIGNFSPESIYDWVKTSTNELLPGQLHSYSSPQPSTPQYIHCQGDGGIQTALSLTFRTMGELDPSFPALLLLNRILDDGLSTLLYQRIVNELGLAYYVSANIDTFTDTGVFEIEAVSVHASIPILLRELLHICDELKTKPLSVAELNHAKRRYRWDLLSACDDPYSLSEWWGATELYYPPLDVTAKLDRIERVTTMDIQTLAQKVFAPQNLTLGSLGTINTKIKSEVKKIFRSYLDSAS